MSAVKEKGKDALETNLTARPLIGSVLETRGQGNSSVALSSFHCRGGAATRSQERMHEATVQVRQTRTISSKV